MHRQTQRLLVQSFSLLNALFLAFQPLLAVPLVLSTPVAVQAESTVNASDVDLSFNTGSHEFELEVTTNDALPFVITYEDENQVPPPPVVQAVSGNLSETGPGQYSATKYAGTCSDTACTPHSFTRGKITIGSSFGRAFRLINNQIVFDSEFQCGTSIFAVNNSSQMHWFDGSSSMNQFAYPLSFASSASADDPQNPRTYYIERYGDRLAYFDHATSTHNIVGSTGIGSASPVTKLAFTTSGTLYGLTDSHHLYSINTSSAFASDLGVVTGIGTGGDIAFDETDVLYLIDTTGNLYSVNIGTLAVALVSSTGLTPVTGLAYQKSTGKLFISRSVSNGTQSSLHSINKDGSGLQQVSVSNQPQINDLSSCVTATQTPPAPSSITIIKDVVPNDSSVWDFTVLPPGNMALGYMDMADGGSHTFSNLVAGSYTLTESTSDEYVTSVSCSNQQSASSNSISFNLVEGEDVTCTFTNTFVGACGDGQVMGQEQCDYGQLLNGQSSCSSQCTWVNECRAEMVANGGFETPIVSQVAGWDAFDNAEVPGWTAAWYDGSSSYNGHTRPDPLIELHRGVIGAASEGQQYVELDTDWTGPDEYSGEPASIALSQDIPTIIGNEYTLSWQYAPRPTYAGNHLEVKVGDALAFNSGVMAGGGTIDWQEQTYSFVASSTLTRISFTEVGVADSFGMFVDDVEVSCNGSTAVTLSAQKVICNSEADLPNWSGSGTAITASTAQDYVNQNSSSCRLADTWDFQWAPSGSGSFGDFQKNGNSLSSPWTTFSAVGGVATTSIPSTSQLGGRIETREVLSTEYVPFSNAGDVSAEFYCTGDVVNYDNWEWINNPQAGQTYYCVGFNAIKSNDVTVCKEDASGIPLSGWKVGLSQPTGFDQTIPVTSGDGVTTNLSSGAYVVYASGTYRYGSEAMIADAGYSFRPVGIPYGTGGWVSGDDLLGYPGALELKLSGGTISEPETNVNWGGFTSEHQYSAYLPGFEGDLNLAIWDDYYGDNLNNGGFRAKIDRSYVSGMTRENGCVTFQDVPYGNYQVFEVGDKNWSYVSTTVDDEVITNYPETVTVGEQVPEIVLTNKFVGGGTIRIVKDVTPDDIQTKFDYTLSNSAGYSVSDKVWEGNPSGYVNLPAGTYTLSEVDLPGYFESISCSTNQTSQTNSITFELKTGDDITCTIANSQYGSFSGKKYVDLYGDGQFGSEDTVYEGWKIKLSVHDGTDYQFLSETTTDNAGNYTFGNLLPGMYLIEEDLSAGEYLATDPNAYGLYNAVLLAAGENLTGFDFGNYKGSTLWGYKYEDKNGNGAWDSEEVGLPNWTIYLDDNVNGQLDPGEPSTQTDQDGKYEFTKLPRGQYHGGYSIKEVLPEGWVITYPDSNNAWKRTTSGSIERQDFGNFKPGTIQGIKYFDADQDGEYDEGESKMQFWGISITSNDMEEQKIVTDADGAFAFTNLKKGTYTLCEEDRTSWGWLSTEPSEELCRTVEIDVSGETETHNFGNYIESGLYILKTNDAWPNDQQIGDEVTYTIRVMAVGGPVTGAQVFDLPPLPFTYVPGSYTAESTERGDLKGTTTTEPVYSSPGVWNLGNLIKDEIVTLTYRAKIGSTDPGIYPDMVWATGTSEQARAQGQAEGDLLALSDPSVNESIGGVNFDGSQGHFGEDNFAGTQVAVVVDQTPSADHQVAVSIKETGSVLGASTELPATGGRFWVSLVAILTVLVGGVMIYLGRRNRSSALAIAVIMGLCLMLAPSAQAATAFRIEQPYNASAELNLDATTNQRDMKIDFVVMNTAGLSVMAQCQQSKDGGSWGDITTKYVVKAGGNSGYCEAKNLDNKSNYDFRVRVSGDGADQYSSTVIVSLDTDGPGTPINYGKFKGNNCEDVIKFRTADDNQTVRVDVYRSDNAEKFAANKETRATQIIIGPKTDHTLTTSKPDCQKTYYYVVRAFDENGNGSGLVGDEILTTVIIEGESGQTQTLTVGAIPVSGVAGGSTLNPLTGQTLAGSTETVAGEDEDTATGEETGEKAQEDTLGEAGEETEEGTVLGETTGGGFFGWLGSLWQSFISWLKSLFGLN